MYLKLKNEAGNEPLRKSRFGRKFGMKYLTTDNRNNGFLLQRANKEDTRAVGSVPQCAHPFYPYVNRQL
jgi:hypothetical protein